MILLHKLVLIGLLSGLAGMAQGQSVWRCGPDGRHYSDTPCAGGTFVALVGARPAADLDSARDVARREQALAAQMARERELRQAQRAASAGPAAIRGSRLTPAAPSAQRARPASRAQGKRPAEESGTWRAVVPSSRRVPG